MKRRTRSCRPRPGTIAATITNTRDGDDERHDHLSGIQSGSRALTAELNADDIRRSLLGSTLQSVLAVLSALILGGIVDRGHR